VRERMWLTRMLTVLSVITSVVILGAVPAHAKQINLTEGINPSAHSVTTHNGTVIAGITFVSESDMPRIKQQQAKSATPQTAAATATVFCYSQWRFITAGGTNAYWKPGIYEYVYASGNRNADYWNQEFLPCYQAGYAMEEWTFLSNATGKYVDTRVTQLAASTTRDDPNFTILTKFTVCYFDGNWISIYLGKEFISGRKLWAYRDPGNAGVFEAYGPLNGNNLFKIDPPIPSGTCVV
jgi:hypothetical protein